MATRGNDPGRPGAAAAGVVRPLGPAALRALSPAFLGRAAPLVVAAAAFAVYAGTLAYGLVWDDELLLITLRQTLERGGPAALLTAEYRVGPHGVPTGFYRPLSFASLWIDLLLGGGRPWVFHLGSILLHALATSLVWLVLGLAGHAGVPALLGALLFALHPAHVESVAWVSGRTDVLAAVFTLAGCALWLRDRREGGGSLALKAAGGASLLLGGLSKETALALPAMLLVWDLLGGPPAGTRRSWWSRNAGWLLSWTMGAALVLAARAATVGAMGGPGSLPWAQGSPSLSSLAAKAVVYLRLLAIPWPLNAGWEPEQVRWSAVNGLAAAGLVLFCLLLARGRGRAGALALAWVAIFLLPVLGIVPFSGPALAERYLYLPSVGLSLALAAATGRLSGSPAGKVAGALCLAAFALLAAGTLSRSSVWRDNLSLYRDVIRTSPGGTLAYFNLGCEYQRRGMLREAEEMYGETVRLRPAHPKVHVNLGNVYLDTGRLAEAEAAFLTALSLDPSAPLVHYNLGRVALMRGDLATARQRHRVLSGLDAGLAGELLAQIADRHHPPAR